MARRQMVVLVPVGVADGVPWLGPDILGHLRALRESGVPHVLACPMGFVAALEIGDLDVEAAEVAAELGLGFERIEMPNADPRFVECSRGCCDGPFRYRRARDPPRRNPIDDVSRRFRVHPKDGAR